MTDAQKRIAQALGAALEEIPEADGVVLLVAYPMLGDEKDKHIEVATAFRKRELDDEELRDLLRTAAGWTEPSRV